MTTPTKTFKAKKPATATAAPVAAAPATAKPATKAPKVA